MKSLSELKVLRRLARLSAVILLAAGGLLCVHSPAAAQEERIDTPYRWIERGTRVGLYGGYLVTNRGRYDMGPGSAVTLGARFRARLSSPLSLEIGVGYGSSDLWVTDPRLEGGPAVVDTVSTDYLLIQAAFQLALTGARSYRRVQPFITIGGGILQELSTGTSDILTVPQGPFAFEIGTAPVIHFGAGAEIDVSDRIGISLEARDNLWRIKTPDGWFRLDVLQNILDSGAPAPQESQWLHNFELTAALYYYF